MARVQPFRAYRPAPGLESQIASPPYDVLDSREARKLAAGNPKSFLHVIKPEIDLPEDIDPHDDRVYETGRANLQRFIRSGYLIREPAPSLYIYRQTMNQHVQTGLVGGASVLEYETDRIKKHEFTRKDKEDDRTRHVETVNANTGPVFLTYRALDRIDSKMSEIAGNRPTYDFTASDGVRHTVWVVSRPEDIRELSVLVEDIPLLYVADGHHRSASAARVGKTRRERDPEPTGEKVYDFFLAVLFPHNQLRIMDYNRVVKDLNHLTEMEYLDRVSARFNIVRTDQPVPPEAGTFGMFLSGSWYRLTVKPGTRFQTDPVGNLDVSILQSNLLGPILGIGDPRTDKRIDFVGGIRGIKELERRVREGDAVAFALHPTSIEQLMSIADAGTVMPPKSTWFEPKLRSGLVVRSLEDI
ncbi:DUF1015 domain-containing protein [bacterium]|nr:DUF1015 domain-containing protein [candidate division CSSED10-310 bacterium]